MDEAATAPYAATPHGRPAPRPPRALHAAQGTGQGSEALYLRVRQRRGGGDSPRRCLRGGAELQRVGAAAPLRRSQEAHPVEVEEGRGAGLGANGEGPPRCRTEVARRASPVMPLLAPQQAMRPCPRFHPSGGGAERQGEGGACSTRSGFRVARATQPLLVLAQPLVSFRPTAPRGWSSAPKRRGCPAPRDRPSTRPTTPSCRPRGPRRRW